MEGSLRKDGDSLRIVVRLIDGTNDAQLWSQRYDRKSTDLLAIQQEVALAATPPDSSSGRPARNSRARSARLR